MTQIQGGPAIPVSVVTGGKIKGGKAIPVYGYTSAPTDGRRAAAGPARPVYVVSDAQMAAGTFQLEGGPALPMYVAPSGLSVVGDAAQPVYVVGGSLGGAATTAWYLAGGAPTPVAAYQADGVLSYAISKINLANPGTYDLADGSHAPTWDTTGWYFPSTLNKYLNTGVLPTDGSWSMFVQVSDQVYTAGGVGEYRFIGQAPQRFFVEVVPGGIGLTYGNNSYLPNSGVEPTSGIFGLTGLRTWRDGYTLGDVSAAIASNSYPIYIGCTNSSGTNYGGCEGKIQRAAIYNTTLTDAQAIAIYEAIKTGKTLPWYLSDSVSATDCVAAYLAKGADSYAASKINLASAGDHALSDGSAPTWASSTGWTFAGAQYLVSDILATSGMTVIAKFANGTWTTAPYYPRIFGVTDTPKSLWIQNAGSNGDPGHTYSHGDETTNIKIGTNLASGILGITDVQGYKNGVADGSTMSGWSGTSTYPMTIGCVNGSSRSHYFFGDLHAIAFYNRALTSYELRRIYQKMTLL